MEKKNLRNIGFYFITDRNLSKKGNVEDVKSAINAGVKIVQYREKEKNTKDMVLESDVIAKICKKNNVLFLLNDRVDVCLGVEADGVHLGQEDMPYEIARRLLGNKIIGLTVHNIENAIEAEKKDVDYISVSPIFYTKTKKDAVKPVGIKLIEEIKNKVKLPIISIGGITKENAASVVKAGADGICAISAVITKDDVEKEIKDFINIINKHKE